MKTKDYLFTIFSAIIWYYFIYFWLHTIKHDVNLFINSLVLLFLGIFGVYLCPLFRKSNLFTRIVGEK